MITPLKLTKKEISNFANSLVDEYIKYIDKPKEDIYKIDMEECLDYLLDKNIISEYDFTDNFGLSEDILGKFYFNERKILIYSGLSVNPFRENFTIAHEIGHCFLHYHLWAKAFNRDNQNTTIFSCSREIIENNKKTSTSFDAIEWQANYFASCLLMPESIIKMNYHTFKALKCKLPQKEANDLNELYTYTNNNDLLGFIKYRMGVSKQTAEYRLSELNLLNAYYLSTSDLDRLSEKYSLKPIYK